MSLVVTKLEELLKRFARRQITLDEYTAKEKELVREEIISWVGQPAIKPYLPRLLHFVLHCEEAAPGLVELTHQRLLGKIANADFAEQIRQEFAVLDRLNAVPWAYGLRVREGPELQHFAPIVEARQPIDPGRPFRRRFRTTVRHQKVARLELWTGPETATHVDTCELRFIHRARLPANLALGQVVEILLERRGGTRLRLGLCLLEDGEERGEDGSWWMECSDGFGELARALPSRASTRVWRPNVQKLVVDIMHCFNTYRPLLEEGEARRMARWIQETSSALTRENEEALRSALAPLVVHLREARPASVVFVLDSILRATEAPESIRVEFEKLARQLFAGDPLPILERNLEEVESWVREWFERLAQLPEKEEGKVIVAPRRVAGLHLHLARAGGRVLKDRTSRDSVAIEQAMVAFQAALDGVLHGDSELSPKDREFLEGVRKTLAKPSSILSRIGSAGIARVMIGSIERFGIITGAPMSPFDFGPAVGVGTRETGRELRRPVSKSGEAYSRSRIYAESSRARTPRAELQRRLVEMTQDWYEVWRREQRAYDSLVEQVPISSNEELGFPVLERLLGALDEDIEIQDAVDQILASEPLESRVFPDLADHFRTSGWFAYAPEKTRERVDEQLAHLEQLGRRWEQEKQFFGKQLLSQFINLRHVLMEAGRDELVSELDQLEAEVLGRDFMRGPAIDLPPAQTMLSSVMSVPANIVSGAVAEADELLEVLPDD